MMSNGNPYRIPPGSPWWHVVNVSGGRSSGYMLAQILRAHDGELPDRTVAVFANTGREREETLRFVRDMSERWCPIVWLEFAYDAARRAGRKYQARVVDFESASRHGEPFDAMLDVARLPSFKSRVCTSMLKVDVIDRYMYRVHGLTKRQTRKVIGFRRDEPARWKPAIYQQCAIVYPMVEAGVTQADVAEFWRGQNFDLGIDSARGNCDLCFLKGRANLIETIRAEPERAQWWMDAEARFPGRTWRPGESFADLARAARAGGIGAITPGADAGDGQFSLPCFCGE